MHADWTEEVLTCQRLRCPKPRPIRLIIQMACKPRCKSHDVSRLLYKRLDTHAHGLLAKAFVQVANHGVHVIIEQNGCTAVRILYFGPHASCLVRSATCLAHLVGKACPAGVCIQITTWQASRVGEAMLKVLHVHMLRMVCANHPTDIQAYIYIGYMHPGPARSNSSWHLDTCYHCICSLSTWCM